MWVATIQSTACGEPAERSRERLRQRGDVGAGPGPEVGFDFADQRLRRHAAVARDLAADEIIGLDGGGAFVDRGDAGVAQMLGGAGLLDEAHAAMDLDAGRGDLDRIFGAPALDDGDQQVDRRLRGLGLGGVRRQMRDIHLARR